MCGIAALWGESDPETIRQILDKLPHRGPDGTGVHVTPVQETVGPATLGHARLAIIDPEGGQQPLIADSVRGAPALVCNGMIYNDLALRARLPGANYATKTDSESILRGFQAWGDRIVDQLDGMFAFVLIDETGHLVAARDPLGIKPLYMAKINGRLAFASEIKALAEVAEDIEEFPAGHVYDSRTGFRQYYEVPAPYTVERGEEDTLQAVRDTLGQAVEKRLRSDVPWGAFLSGGLDSSIIAALAMQHVDELNTFAVGLDGSSDVIAARQVAEYLGTTHHEYLIPPEEVIEVLPHVLHHLESYDRDLVRSAVPTYFVARLAARHAKVVLTGRGRGRAVRRLRLLRRLHRRRRPAGRTAAIAAVDAQRQPAARRPDDHGARPGSARALPGHPAGRSGDGHPRPSQAAGGGWLRRREVGAAQGVRGWLPDNIVWRGKLQFDQGSGFSDYLANYAEGERKAGRIATDDTARSAEEALYRSLLARTFKDPDLVLSLTAHWDHGRADQPAKAVE